MMTKYFVSLLSIVLICATVVAATAAKKEVNKEAGSEYKLDRVAGKTPQESMATIEVAPGYRIELVAAEPTVIDPVAISTDEDGKMYVVEMRDYSEQDKDFLGRIRTLTDKDGDGKYETSKVFLDKLSWPTAVLCYGGGVFIGDPPDILYAKDTDGDGVADVKQVIYTGFSRKNVQGMMNTFLWGLDHRLYGTSSSTGGQIKRIALGTLDDVVKGTSPIAKGEDAKSIDFHNRDFAIDPKTLDMTPLTGGGQHGMTFDRWGNRFVCSNSDHLQAIVFEERYLNRNPYQSVVSPRRSIASDGPQAEVFRISPIEAWRIARTEMRVSGKASGPIEGGGRAGGYFTGATGVTVYEGGLWPTTGDTIVLTSDVGSNLIHRKRLVPDGVTYRGDRIDKGTEFIRAKDIWFRPVQMSLGADGSLLICDMCRETIEHPASLPGGLKKQLNLATSSRGRIYRVVPIEYQYQQPAWLGGASAEELVDALDSPNQWRRMTALRLIYERQQPETAALLRAAILECQRPEARIDMLYALDSLKMLAQADVLAALSDRDPQVRRHGLRLSEPMLNQSAAVREKAVSLAGDADPVVQFQLALSLGECRDAAATQAIASILIRDSKSRDITDAALTSIVDRAGSVLKLLLADSKWAATPEAEQPLTAIVSQIVRQRHEQDVQILVDVLRPTAATRRSAGTLGVLKALSHLPASLLAGKEPQIVKLQELRAMAAKSLIAEARQVLEQKDAKEADRLAAVSELALDRFEAQQELLDQLLSPQESAAVRAEAIGAMAQYESPAVADLILARYAQLSPAERLKATDVLLRRGAWALAFAKFLANGDVPITTLDPSHVTKLQNYPAPKVREIVRKLKGQGLATDRQKVFQEFKDAGILAGGGDPVQGRVVFERACATCHEIGGVGHAVGPNLASMVNRGAESVLFNVLNPNAEVDPRFMEYVVATADGQVITGVVAGETPTAVTLRGSENKTTTVLRVDIDDIHSTGKSLMPEGMEKVVDKRAMKNLLAFLQQAAAAQGGK